VIGDTFPPERRGRALGLIGAVFGIAFLLGPILGGALLLLGWQWLFLINLPIAAVVLVAALRLLPGPALVPAEQLELRAMGMFRNRQVLLVGLLALGAGLSEAVTLFIPSLLVESFQVTPSNASFMLIPMVLAMAVASPYSGRVLDQAGSRVVVVAGAALIGVSLIIEGMFAASLPLYYLFAVLFGLGIGVLLGASLRYIILNEATPAERGTAQSLLTLALGVGQLGGAALMGAIAARQGGTAGYTTALLASGGVMLLMTLAATQLKDRSAEIATRRDQPAGAV
jgi:MFS family permease